MEKTALRIRLFGEPALRKKTRSVKEITQERAQILSRMAQLMYESAGVGLAAPQVGINESMIVVDAGSGLYKLVNPRVVRKSGSQVLEEGCLSVPGVCIKVRRAKKILVRGLDEKSQSVSIEAEDLLACVFQHEIDHLKGRLIVDYATFLDKLKISKRLKELKKIAQNERLPESKAKSCKLQL